MTVHSDEGLQQQLTEYASTLADIPEFLDQVKERLGILKDERDRSEKETGEVQGELAIADDDLAATLSEVRENIAHDLAILIDWALDAGADPAALEGLKNEISTETIKARALARSAF